MKLLKKPKKNRPVAFFSGFKEFMEMYSLISQPQVFIRGTTVLFCLTSFSAPEVAA